MFFGRFFQKGTGFLMPRLHASCAAHGGDGVLLLGPPGAGKSSLLLRLLDRGFALVADDQVELTGSTAHVPAALAGLIEVRGLGLLRLPYQAQAEVRLVVQLERGDRLPEPKHFSDLHLPMVYVDPHAAAAPQIVALALDCVRGKLSLVAGALA
jgi:HPr kinase/phosphorylase